MATFALKERVIFKPAHCPKSGQVARSVYRCVREHQPPVVAVTIEETCTNVCTYRP